MRAHTVAALGHMGPGAVGPLVAALDHADALVRRGAAKALSLRGPAAAPALPRLLKALDDPDLEPLWAEIGEI